MSAAISFATSTPPTRLHLTVRFTELSIPDLSLTILEPSTTTVLLLKKEIRNRLPPTSSNKRLRLIYGGKILLDAALLPSVIRTPPPPPRTVVDPKGKGKEVENSPAPALVFINCSIGDVLTAKELEAEELAAQVTVFSSLQTENDALARHGPPPITTSTTTNPAPRGFDRLLSTGLTASEVRQLRLQYQAMQASIHTPDTMPSPTTLRRMEDEWIDNSGSTTAGGNEADAELVGGALDDLIWGHIMGFLWPLGSMAWLNREPGVWSDRRQMAVWTGFMLCMAFGIFNIMG